jgi:4-carboxymuconolactone decarboxylase
MWSIYPVTAVVLMLAVFQPAHAQDRLPPIPASEMSQAQRTIVETFEIERGYALRGPWVPLLRSPEILDLMIDVRDHVRDRSLLTFKHTEFVILLAAREWTQHYVWNAHYPAAIEAGLDPEVIVAIADGRRPEHMSDQEGILYDLSMELHRNKQVSDATYDQAVGVFGQERVVEAVAIGGYYSLLAMVMNTGRTPLRDGVELPPVTLSSFPR